MIAVIMAGGKGTRLNGVIQDIPKPMTIINNKPILQYQIESLRDSGITNIILVVGYLREKIKEYFTDGTEFGVNISYIEEDEPLGTAGALYFLKNQIHEDFFLIFGDLMLDIDWKRFAEFHKFKNAKITLFVHPNTHPYDSDLVMLDSENLVVGIDSKNNERCYYYHNLVNAGLYMISPEVLKKISEVKRLDLERDLIIPEIARGIVFGYQSTEYVKDMGTPERLKAVSENLKAGVVRQKKLSNKQSAIFLDRDGTINESNGFINTVNKFKLLENVPNAIRLINESKFLCIVITNQPVLARGECSIEELEEIHKKMETQLGESGSYIDALFYCPHHPHKGYPGEVRELKIQCTCRKPDIGLIKAAEKEYNIDLDSSWFIGDTTTDMKTGENANLKTALVLTGEKGMDGKFNSKPTIIKENLLEAVTMILSLEKS